MPASKSSESQNKYRINVEFSVAGITCQATLKTNWRLANTEHFEFIVKTVKEALGTDKNIEIINISTLNDQLETSLSQILGKGQ